MTTAKNLYNLDSLEKEIHRLRLEATFKEKKLADNLIFLTENAGSLLVHSFLCKKKDTNDTKKSEAEGFFKNEKLNSLLGKIADRITDRAVEGIDNLLEKTFHKRKHHFNE